MKRLILLGAASLALLLTLASCGCQHTWADATCTAPKTCTQCGKTEGEPLEHQWTDATCTEPPTCILCGETTGEPLGHLVSEWTEETPSTCAEAGTETGLCSRCGEIAVQALPLAEHTPGDWTIKTAAEKGTAGVRVKTCTLCGAELETEEYTLTDAELKEQFIAQCHTYSYDEIARNPNNYFGKSAKFRGEVIQVLPEGDSYTLRVNITSGRYTWSDTILVTYTKQDPNEGNILEDDIVMLYGTLMGTYTYETVMGANLTVPFLSAKYIDIQ